MTYQSALMQAQARTGSSLDSSRTMGLLQASLENFWSEFPWEESLGNGYPFLLVPYRETYKPPFIQIPSDFRSIYSAQLWKLDSSGTSKELPIETAARRGRRPGRGVPEWMAYSSEKNGFRFDRIYWVENPSGFYLVEYKYKRTSPVLTRSSLETDFPIPRLFTHFVKLLATYLLPGQATREVLALRQAILVAAAVSDGLLDSPDFIEPQIGWNT